MKSKLLIVDDDHNMLSMMEQALKPLYDVTSVSSGEQALRMLAPPGTRTAPKPDLIFLDIDMPGMNGYEVLDRLNQDEELKKIPVVFLTGLTDE
ncbi:MAG: response regulator [Oscillospiraceae bacterium]|nr:response regulator [Oscillospiraceae bacterium]